MLEKLYFKNSRYWKSCKNIFQNTVHVKAHDIGKYISEFARGVLDNALP